MHQYSRHPKELTLLSQKVPEEEPKGTQGTSETPQEGLLPSRKPTRYQPREEQEKSRDGRLTETLEALRRVLPCWIREEARGEKDLHPQQTLVEERKYIKVNPYLKKVEQDGLVFV